MSEQAATPAPTAAARPAEKAESLLLRHVAAFFESPLAVVGLAGLVLLVAGGCGATALAASRASCTHWATLNG